MNMLFEWIVAIVLGLCLILLARPPRRPDPPRNDDDQEDW